MCLIGLAFRIQGRQQQGIALASVKLRKGRKPQVMSSSEPACSSVKWAGIANGLTQHSEAIVSVRGKDRFVVMDIARYHHLRECELDAALAQTRADLAAGRFVQESPEAHLARLDKLA